MDGWETSSETVRVLSYRLELPSLRDSPERGKLELVGVPGKCDSSDGFDAKKTNDN